MIIDLPETKYIPRAEVGDIVYYISPLNRYAVKRSVVVNIKEGYSCGRKVYEQVMQNGDIVLKNCGDSEDNSTFPTFEVAVSHIMATLAESINSDQFYLNNLVNNLKKKQRILATIKNSYPELAPQRFKCQADMDASFFKVDHFIIDEYNVEDEFY
jgi:hypothetical protein